MLTSRWTRWSIVLGVGLGGFFDGILLHQILQWHHLLSLVPGMEDLRTQVLWDGYFHALMYVVAGVGLWGLWRAHRRLEGGSGPQLLGGLLIGFGLWHILDGVLSHWLLGIHRIKLDSPNPLMWDLIWFFAFGVLPAVAGLFLLRRDGGSGQGLPRAGLALLLVGAVTVASGAWALRPPPGQPFTTIVFSPGVGPGEVMAAIADADGRLVWSDPAMGVVVVDVAPDQRWSFYRAGALLVGGSGLTAGCFDWVRA